MFLWIGLGNPGQDHAKDRHNVGFMAIDKIAAHLSLPAFRVKHKAEVTEANLHGKKIILAKPQTFMNLSGESVGALCRFYKIPPEDVLVFYDELELPVAKLRTKQGGGAAGHNGIRSVDEAIGKNYHRLRIGIDHPGHKDRVTSYVLGRFTEDEQIMIDRLLEKMATMTDLLVSKKFAKLTSDLALALGPSPQEKEKEKKKEKKESQNGI